MEPVNSRNSWGKSWKTLILNFFFLWFFAFVAGPWGEKNIPVFSSITQTIEENNIDSTAYMYTEIEGSYNGEKNLLSSLRLKIPEKTGFTLEFLSGIAICLGLLIWGFKNLPIDDNHD